MKGIILAGGKGSRLLPLTLGVSKQLLPVYDKPLVHYPIATLMLAGIQEFLVITTPQDQTNFQRLLGSGDELGVNFSYATQAIPRGIVDAILIGEKFVGGDSVALILGDNIFHGQGLGQELRKVKISSGATIFAYRVANASEYGVVKFDENNLPLELIEKPKDMTLGYAIPGLYFYENSVIEVAKLVQESDRGELEITSLNQMLLRDGKLDVRRLQRGTTWFDAGTIEGLFSATSFIKAVEERQGYKIACVEEIAWRNSWITDAQLHNLAEKYSNSSYGTYLRQLI